MRIKTTEIRYLLVLTAACLLQACDSSGSGDEPTAAPTAVAGGSQALRAAGVSGVGPVPEATDLRAEIFCDPAVPRKGLAQLSWTPADPLGQEQRVLVTIFKEGFETGAFEESKPLPPDQDTFLLESVQGQAIHRWRVVTVRTSAEMPSETARFEGPVCINDEVIDQPVPIP